VRFTVGADGVRAPAFVVRFKGKAYAYFNRCAHIGLELLISSQNSLHMI